VQLLSNYNVKCNCMLNDSCYGTTPNGAPCFPDFTSSRQPSKRAQNGRTGIIKGVSSRSPVTVSWGTVGAGRVYRKDGKIASRTECFFCLLGESTYFTTLALQILLLLLQKIANSACSHDKRQIKASFTAVANLTVAIANEALLSPCPILCS
jgi:hypothetical protein